MEPKLRSAILIISDTTPEGSASGFTAKDSSFILSGHEIWDPPSIRVIPDNLNRIRNAVCACTDSLNAIDLVLISDNREIAVNNNVFEVRFFDFKMKSLCVNYIPRLSLHYSIVASQTWSKYTSQRFSSLDID